MPGRTAGRSSRQAGQRSRARSSSPQSNIPDEGPSTSLRQSICQIFSDVHKSSTGQRKLVVALRKAQETCCYEPAKAKKQTPEEDFDEAEFNSEVARCVTRILFVRKSEPAGDRVVKFLATFLKYATEQDNAIFRGDAEDVTFIPETPSSRLTANIIQLLLPLLVAKDKIVRFRCTQIIAHLINTLDSIDDELFDYIRIAFLKRLRDKESSIRVQAVYGLGRLAGEGIDEEDSDGSEDEKYGSVLDKLLALLQNDPSAEVRRSLLLNLPFTKSTLPLLLERARDQDPSIRRALYGRLLPALGDFRHLSLTHREKLLRWGLRDRDDNVRKAAAKLFGERWIEDCAKPKDENGEPIEPEAGQQVEPSIEGLLELLERIDIVNAGAEGGIAIDAMRDFWDRRPDYRALLNFDEAYWKQLTPESVFVARTFTDFCIQNPSTDLEEKLPEVSRLAYLIQANINALVTLVQKVATEEEAEEDSVQQEFVVEQLLQIALTLDYADEVGRYTMFSLMREALALAELPEEATRLVVDVLRLTCGNDASGEREFCGIVLEAVAEVHDTIMGEEPEKAPDDVDDSFHSAKSEISGDSTPRNTRQDEEFDQEKAIREIMVNMKCLHIAQCMLQNVESGLEQNAHLITMLNNLVVPAVRSQEAPIRERGLLCLGLCCLLDKNLAMENLTLFLHCFNKGHEQLQCIAIQIIGDVLSAHSSLLAVSAVQEDDNSEKSPSEDQVLQKSIYKFFSKALKSSEPTVQSTGCTALCKLMLASPASSTDTSNILNSDELLKALVTAYFEPEYRVNPALRQSLSYFLPVYCYSKLENMQRMGRIAPSIMSWYLGIKEELDVDGSEDPSDDLISITVVVAHLLDWTDGRKLAVGTGGLKEDASKDADSDVQLDLAADLYEKMLGVCSKEERKLFISALGKLYISHTSSNSKLSTVLSLTEEAIADRIATDAPSKATLNKVQVNLTKAIERQQDTSRTGTAPSVAGDWSDAETSKEVRSDDETIASAMTTPATSPRKRMARSSRKPVDAMSDIDESKEVEMSEAASIATVTPQQSPARRHESSAPSNETDPPPFILPRPTDNIPLLAVPAADILVPQKKTRGRPKKSATPPEDVKPDGDEQILAPSTSRHNRAGVRNRVAKPAPEPVDDDEDTLMIDVADTDENGAVPVKQEADDDFTEVTQQAPAPKRRGRPAKAAGKPAAPRRSVRASRRVTTAGTSTAGDDEDDL